MRINFTFIQRMVLVCLFSTLVPISYAAELSSLTVYPNSCSITTVNLPSRMVTTETYIRIRVARSLTPKFSIAPIDGSCPFLPLESGQRTCQVYLGMDNIASLELDKIDENIYLLTIYHDPDCIPHQQDHTQYYIQWQLMIWNTSGSSQDFSYSIDTLNAGGVPAYRLTPEYNTSQTMDFSINGQLYINTSVVLNAKISSYGTDAVIIVDAVHNDPGCNVFSFPSQAGATILPNDSKTFPITFNSTSTGNFSCNLSFNAGQNAIGNTLQLIANNVSQQSGGGQGGGGFSCIQWIGPERIGRDYFNACDLNKYIYFDWSRLIHGPIPPGCPMCMEGVITTPDPVYLPLDYQRVADKLDFKVTSVQKVISSVKKPDGSFTVTFLFSDQDRPMLSISSGGKTVFSKPFPTIEENDFAGGIKEFTPGNMVNSRKLYYVTKPSSMIASPMITIKEIDINNEYKFQAALDVKLGKEAIYSRKGALTLGIGGQMIYRPERIIKNIPGDDVTIFVSPKDSSSRVQEFFTVEVKAPKSNRFIYLGSSPGKTCSFDISSIGLSEVEEIRITDRSVQSTDQNPGVTINAIGVWRVPRIQK